MALKLTLDSLDAVDEPLRDLYEEVDGKYRLSVDGVEDTSGLKSALEKERKAAKELANKVKRWEGLGKSEDEIADLLRTIEETDRKKATEEGDFSKLLTQHQDKWAKEKASLEAELNAARASERSAIVENGIMAALTRESATEEGVDLLPDRLANRIKFETEDGKRVLTIMQADGETPMAGTGKDGRATLDDLVKEAAQKWPSLFKASGHTGGGMRPGDRPGGAGIKKKSDFKSEKDRAEFVQKNGMEAYKALAD